MFDPGTFGKTPLIPFVGMVIGFNSQRKQISGLGWGWRYKVRIIGDYSEKDTIKEQDIRYAIVMLPTTAGSGGGGRLTPVRIAQGDMVFGFYANGDDGLPIITGVFPRTRFHALKDIQQSVWDKITGWFGTIQPGVLGRQENNEQGGAAETISMYGEPDAGATKIRIIQDQALGASSTFVWSDKFVLAAGDYLLVDCASAAYVDFHLSYIDQDWS